MLNDFGNSIEMFGGLDTVVTEIPGISAKMLDDVAGIWCCFLLSLFSSERFGGFGGGTIGWFCMLFNNELPDSWWYELPFTFVAMDMLGVMVSSPLPTLITVVVDGLELVNGPVVFVDG